ncbi:hypothetical protein L596_025235 [Steinernema carpocapsae]|uniref:Uncharacterized protein n=1 Tax=Steinernema carpocapsae TaxID=34508 RepID=A0A4U5M766_STECR|nr:hypothetical protein L596_025235 [Steinernema carpocapsae]
MSRFIPNPCRNVAIVHRQLTLSSARLKDRPNITQRGSQQLSLRGQEVTGSTDPNHRHFQIARVSGTKTNRSNKRSCRQTDHFRNK